MQKVIVTLKLRSFKRYNAHIEVYCNAIDYENMNTFEYKRTIKS
jgi:hypothetical protein